MQQQVMRPGDVSDFIYKPGPSGGKPPVFLAPANRPRDVVPIFVGADGTEYRGEYYNTNEGRHQYLFPREVLNQQGGQIRYGETVQPIANSNQAYDGDFETNWNRRAGGKGDYRGGAGSGGGNVGSTPNTVGMSPGGNYGVFPGSVDFGGLDFIEADWNQAMADARAAGDEAKIEYLQNIQDARQPALDLVDTDITGIEMGLDRLGPRVRQEGQRDTETNIDRADQIDEFNRGRLPGFNSFNRGQISQTNDFNRGEFEEAVDSSGIDYRRRVTEVLDDLRTESKGRLSDDMLDELWTTTARNRGAELSGAAGVGSASPAGVNAQDRLDINQRVQMALDAQARIPGIAGQAQQLLQPPIEVAKTQQLTPTTVPLNTSNVADRVPIQPNISAGSTAAGIANTAQSYESIPATSALSTNLDTQRFNSEGNWRRDWAVANAQQSVLTAEGNAIQGLINADKADELRDQQFDQFSAGLETRGQNEAIGAGASALGTIGGAIATGIAAGFGGGAAGGGTATGGPGSAGTVGAGNQTIDGQGNVIGTIQTPPDVFADESSGGGYSDASGGFAGAGGSTIDPVTGTTTGGVINQSPYDIPLPSESDGFSTGGSSGTVLADDFNPPQQAYGPPGLSGGDYGGYSGPIQSSSGFELPSFDSPGGFIPPSDGGSAGIGAPAFEGGEMYRVGNTQVAKGDYEASMAAADSYINGTAGTSAPAAPQASEADTFLPDSGSGAIGMPKDSTGFSGAFRDVIGAVRDTGIDASVIANGISLLTSWKEMSPGKRIAAAGQIGTTILSNKGVITPNEAKAIGAAAGALAMLSNPNASVSEKAAAFGTIGARDTMLRFTGTIDRPTTIGGQAVVGVAPAQNGAVGYKLSDGRIVSRPTLQAAADAQGAMGAFRVLTSTANRDKKIAALSSIGVDPGAADDLVRETENGNTLAALSLFNTAMKWEDQTDVQKAASVIQTTSTVQSTFASALPSAVLKSNAGTGASTLKDLKLGPNVTVGQTGISINGSVAGHDVSINPLTGSGSIDFYGIPIPLNPTRITPVGGPQGVTMGDSKEGVSVGANGLTVSAGGVRAGVTPRGGAYASVSGSSGDVRGSVNAGVSPAGGVSVTPNVQIGTGPGAQTGSQVGGQVGGAIGSSIFGPVGGAVGSFIGSAIGSVIGGSIMGSPSGQDMRNGYRRNLDKMGLIDKGRKGEWYVTLADGSKYDFGADGSTTFKNTDGTERFSYEVDWTNPLAADSIPAAHILEIATGLDPSFTKKDTFNRVAGQLTNAITSNARTLDDTYKNVKTMLDRQGVTPQNLGMRIESLRVTNAISDQEYEVYLDQMNKIYGTQFRPQDRAQSETAFLSMLEGKKKMDKADKEFYSMLKDPKKLAESKKKTEARIAGLRKNEQGGLPIPDRYQPEMMAA